MHIYRVTDFTFVLDYFRFDTKPALLAVNKFLALESICNSMHLFDLETLYAAIADKYSYRYGAPSYGVRMP